MPGDATGGARPGSPYLQIGTMVGGYRIESFVAHGGMAFVYEATDLRLGRHVALKLLIAGTVYHAHASVTDFFQYAVVGDGLADKRAGIRHSAAILGWRSGRVNESVRLSASNS